MGHGSAILLFYLLCQVNIRLTLGQHLPLLSTPHETFPELTGYPLSVCAIMYGYTLALRHVNDTFTTFMDHIISW